MRYALLFCFRLCPCYDAPWCLMICALSPSVCARHMRYHDRLVWCAMRCRFLRLLRLLIYATDTALLVKIRRYAPYSAIVGACFRPIYASIFFAHISPYVDACLRDFFRRARHASIFSPLLRYADIFFDSRSAVLCWAMPCCLPLLIFAALFFHARRFSFFMSPAFSCCSTYFIIASTPIVVYVIDTISRLLIHADVADYDIIFVAPYAILLCQPCFVLSADATFIISCFTFFYLFFACHFMLHAHADNVWCYFWCSRDICRRDIHTPMIFADLLISRYATLFTLFFDAFMPLLPYAFDARLRAMPPEAEMSHQPAAPATRRLMMLLPLMLRHLPCLLLLSGSCESARYYFDERYAHAYAILLPDAYMPARHAYANCYYIWYMLCLLLLSILFMIFAPLCAMILPAIFFVAAWCWHAAITPCSPPWLRCFDAFALAIDSSFPPLCHTCHVLLFRLYYCHYRFSMPLLTPLFIFAPRYAMPCFATLRCWFSLVAMSVHTLFCRAYALYAPLCWCVYAYDDAPALRRAAHVAAAPFYALIRYEDGYCLFCCSRCYFIMLCLFDFAMLLRYFSRVLHTMLMRYWCRLILLCRWWYWWSIWCLMIWRAIRLCRARAFVALPRVICFDTLFFFSSRYVYARRVCFFFLQAMRDMSILFLFPCSHATPPFIRPARYLLCLRACLLRDNVAQQHARDIRYGWCPARIRFHYMLFTRRADIMRERPCVIYARVPC